jgi:hypothetical protein
MGSHHEEPPIQLEDVPEEEAMSTAEAQEDLEQEPDEKSNFTERHPEHFRNPPGHVRELRDDGAGERSED